MSDSPEVPVLGKASNALICGCVVGESLIWDDRREQLLWVDMLSHRIHVLAPARNLHQQYQTPGMVTSIGLRKDGGYIVGLHRTVALWDPETGFETLLELEPDRPMNRLNEGVVGPDGCFWVGTMQNNVDQDGQPQDQTAATGQVWRVTPDGQAELMCGEGFWLTNTIAWIRDRVIVGDTGQNTLFSFSSETSNRGLSNKQDFLKDYDKGLPDGSCVDADDHLWNCRVVGGAEVLRISPAGTPVGAIQTPCSWPTSCVFGGPDLDRLYISSARFTMSETQLRERPWEGDLFVCPIPGVRGRLHYRFG